MTWARWRLGNESVLVTLFMPRHKIANRLLGLRRHWKRKEREGGMGRCRTVRWGERGVVHSTGGSIVYQMYKQGGAQD